jgi:hypothetical protein
MMSLIARSKIPFCFYHSEIHESGMKIQQKENE